MPRQKKTPIPPSNTSHLFGGRKTVDRGGGVTRERIADDMEAFRKAGGRIEVLGITRSLTKIDPGADTPAAPAHPGPKSRR
ncbi:MULTISPECIES: hypothetical protein [unclassified Lysobacter]|jgi:hypothetical protein|uniref:hypothetical protein n=1 Tax=unclassified Lysobacter TaxID=2635362 RepID=UPI001F597C28|nr:MULTISPECIES: hypothetical protein [unclassified Lysobacter]HEX5662243.1 hypothetical protein [Xanthomonadaceae bacterium]